MPLAQKTITDQNMLEWQQFLKTGTCLENKVRPEILASWKRCLKLGIDPYNNAKHSSLDSKKMTEALAKNKDFLDIARPFMANLYKIVAGSGFVVVLTDASGYILELFADKDHPVINSITANFFPGACWSEAVAGTNAIGTTMVQKEPLQVNGSEHYCYKHHLLTCSAAPISDADGNLIGILAISGVAVAAHTHTLGMAVAAAASIMAQMSILGKNR
ncbi:MAG: GAF domain-containing protein, partial [Sporomusaceae bacterium]|nr:GAF domain-containing protein [Sporomusaceae bacterium]